ncbi:MAG: DNA polymerase Y family protein [Gemmataceae bacterium]|nr:DNA polymerase Y family protein [Gemmataceae bacterium]
MPRVLCAYFPNWPLQRWRHHQPQLRQRPVALAEPTTAARPRIVTCCAEAARLGYRPGKPLAEAWAIAPSLVLRTLDPEGDRRALEALAVWFGRFSPSVGLEDGPAPESLLADVTGCALLFDGEARLVERAEGQLRENGWQACLALAETVGAAWAVAHYAATPAVVPPEATEAALRPLPVAALRLPGDTLALLSELGIERIGQLLELPRAEVPARFGPTVLLQLDRALGRLPELFLPHRPSSPIEACCRFEYATDQGNVLRHALEQLIDDIQGALERRQLGACQLECSLWGETALGARLEVRLFRPTQARAHLAALLHARLEQVPLAEPIAAIRLRVVAAEPLGGQQASLVEQTAGSRDLALLIDRLSNELGREAVVRPVLVPDPQPEYACRFEPLIGREHSRQATAGLGPSPASGLGTAAGRPLHLWDTPVRIEVLRAVPAGAPVRFRWAGKDHRVAHSRGPERIATGWWRGRDVHRDYYVVTTEAGTRYWLFRNREDGSWFLHGCFD